MTTVYCDESRPDDSGDGLWPHSAKKTLAAAVPLWRSLSASAQGNVNLMLRRPASPDVTYNLTAPQNWANIHNPPDPLSRVRIGAYGDGHRPYISAHLPVTGWVDMGGGIVRAPFANSIRNLWIGSRHRLHRARFGRYDNNSRMIRFDDPNRWFILPTSKVPNVSNWSGVEITVVIGWQISIMRIASMIDIGGGETAMTPMEPERIAEFDRKVLGPFHSVGAKRMWFSNAYSFITEPGEWWHDAAEGFIYMKLPTGLANAEAVEAAQVWAPNGVSTAFNFYSNTVSSPVRNIDINGIGFKHFGYELPSQEGHIGVLYDGTAVFDNNGVPGYRQLAAVLNFWRGRSLSVTDTYFDECAATALRFRFACQGMVTRDNIYTRLGGSATAGGGAIAPFDTLQEDEQQGEWLDEQSIAVDCGQDYAATSMHHGALRNSTIRHQHCERAEGGGVQIGTGARWLGIWTVNNEISHCRVRNVLTMVHDAGGIYTSGNQTGASINYNWANLVPPWGTLRIVNNWVSQVLWHDNDPSGGHQPGIYLDLGCRGAIVEGNRLSNVETACQSNCAGWNMWRNNTILNAGRIRRVFYSSFNVFDRDGVPTFYQAPRGNPGSADDLARYNGTGIYEGRAFRDLGIMPSYDALVAPGTVNAAAQGDYGSPDLFTYNTDASYIPPRVGPRQEMYQRYTELTGEDLLAA